MLMVGWLLWIEGFGEEMSVKGVVKERRGEGIMGGNVVVKGRRNGSMSDFEGKLVLKGNKGDIIVIWFMG